MENEEMLEQANNEVEEETTEEDVGIELTDTEEVQEEEEKPKTLKELLKEHPEYQEELNEEIIKPRLDRKNREFQKELSKYKRTKDLLGVSFESDDIDEINENMEEYLKENGYDIPSNSTESLSEEEYEILGNAEANKIIDLGENEIIDELNRLKNFKYEELTSKEKYVYKRLYEKLEENKKIDELRKNGIDLSILDNKEFKTFEKKFSKNTSLLEIVNMYNKISDGTSTPVKIGDLKSNSEKGVKDFYTEKEIKNLTMEDLDKPGVFEAVRRSMTKQKK